VFAGASELSRAESLSTNVGGISMSPAEPRTGAIFWNPAVIGGVNGTEFETNVALVGGYFTYDRAGANPLTGQSYDRSSAGLMAPNPYLGVTSDFGISDLRFAYNTYFPSGIKADF